MVSVTLYSADALFAIEQPGANQNLPDGPGCPPWASLRFRYDGTARPGLRGGGIYAVMYRNHLAYVGSFLGNGALLTGDVAADRWSKHLETLTLRGRNIIFAPAVFDQVLEQLVGPIVDGLVAFPGPRGRDRYRSSLGKAAFANRHWKDFIQLEHQPDLFSQISFAYASISEEEAEAADVSAARRIKAAETELIQTLRPYCNTRDMAGVVPLEIEREPSAVAGLLAASLIEAFLAPRRLGP